MFKRSIATAAVCGLSLFGLTAVAGAAGSPGDPSADIAVTDSASRPLVQWQTFVTETYTATVTNLGPDDAQNVVMHSAGAFLGVTAPTGVSVSCASSSGTTTCTTPWLPASQPGNPKTVTIRTTNRVFFIHNHCAEWFGASASSVTFDPILNNNTATVMIRSNQLGC